MTDLTISMFPSSKIYRLSIFALVATALVLSGCEKTVDSSKPPAKQEEVTSNEDAIKFDFDGILNRKEVKNAPTFVEVAKQYGIDFQYYNDAREARYFFPEILGGGFACLDYDLDGWPDIYCTNGRGLPINSVDADYDDQLFRNLSGKTFSSSTIASHLSETRFSHGCAFGDLNADGFDDIAVGNFGGISVYLNQGDGTFSLTADSTFNADPTWSVCPIIADFNHDNIHDLLIVNYVQWNYEVPACTYDAIRGYCGPGEFEAARDYFFLNQGNGSFVECGDSFGFTAMGKGLASAALDWDHDLKCDLYIANDLVANFLYKIDAESTNHYSEVGSSAGVAVCVNGLNEASMSVTPADFDRNGWSDIFVTNYYKRKNTVYLNQESAHFQDASFSARTQATGELFLGFGAVTVDYDKDGWIDLFIGNGHVLGPEHNPNQLTNQILRNEDGVFTDVSQSGGEFFSEKTLSRGVATIDFDQDLDTDIIVNHLDRPVSLLRNDSQTKFNSVSLELCSPKHLPLEGSRIEITQDGKTQALPYFSGGSYFSDSERKWTIGLGDAQVIEKIVVYWKDGSVDTWTDLAAGCQWRFIPGKYIRL